MSGEGFLTRWSRLKRKSAAPVETASPAAEPVVENPGEPATATSPELSLDQLRALWRSDPALSSADPLEIHNLDYPAADGSNLVESVWLASQRLLAADETAEETAEKTAPIPPAAEDETPG